jgi:hypothetical protein
MSWLNGDYTLVGSPSGDILSDTTWTDVDEYIVASNTDGGGNLGQYLMFWSKDADVGDWMEVKDVSVEELGEDWDNMDDASSIDENGLTISTSSGSGSYKDRQSSISLYSGKSYKVTYTIYANNLTGDNVLQYYNGDYYDSFSEQGVGTHTEYFTRIGTDSNLWWYFKIYAPNGSTTDTVTISSIIVEELGEDWTQGIGWTIGDSKAISAQALGGELVTNGDFSATGSDVIVDGDFPTPNVNWTLINATLDSGGARIDNGATTDNAYILQALTNSPSGKDFVLTYDVIATNGELLAIEQLSEVVLDTATTGTNRKVYFTWDRANDQLVIKRKCCESVDITIDNVRLQELGEDWTLGTGWSVGENKAIATAGDSGKIKQTINLSGKYAKVVFTLSDYGGSGICKVDFGSTSSDAIDSDGTHIVYGIYDINYFELWRNSDFSGDVTNISVEEIATSYLAQDGILTVNRTYKFGYTISNYSAGTVSATDYGAVKDEDEVVLDTVKVEGVDFSIKNIDGYFVGDISSVSAKLLGTYLEQSIYVTAADIQTIAQASVYYLVELTSMASKNSLYFLPSSVVANNGRYTKLNFTVISKDATPTPAVGIISFYDSVGGFDTYPMGFYEFKIYEQTSSTNLDPSLATGLLEKGFAFVRDFSGNMQELTDDFNEYDPTLTQYVYTK